MYSTRLAAAFRSLAVIRFVARPLDCAASRLASEDISSKRRSSCVRSSTDCLKTFERSLAFLNNPVQVVDHCSFFGGEGTFGGFVEEVVGDFGPRVHEHGRDLNFDVGVCILVFILMECLRLQTNKVVLGDVAQRVSRCSVSGEALGGAHLGELLFNDLPHGFAVGGQVQRHADTSHIDDVVVDVLKRLVILGLVPLEELAS